MNGVTVTVKPVLLGYVQRRLGTSAQEVAEKRVRLAAFAEAEGYALAEVFVDVDYDRPLSAFAALIAAANACEVSAVAVAAAEDLGRLDHVRLVMRRRLEAEAGVRVLVAPSSGQPSLVGCRVAS